MTRAEVAGAGDGHSDAEDGGEMETGDPWTEVVDLARGRSGVAGDDARVRLRPEKSSGSLGAEKVRGK